MEDAPRMFGNHDLMTSWCHLWYNLYSAASTQPTLVVNPQIELASSSSENEESLCQEDIQKLLGLQVWGDFIWVENTIISDLRFSVSGQPGQSWQVGPGLENSWE